MKTLPKKLAVFLMIFGMFLSIAPAALAYGGSSSDPGPPPRPTPPPWDFPGDWEPPAPWSGPSGN